MATQRKNLHLALISIGLLMIILLTRGIGLAKFVSLDEPAWLLFASNYYLALTKGDFERTAIDYGLTTLWILTLAFLTYFPRFNLVAKYTDKYWTIDQLFHKYNKSPLTLLVRGRMISIVAISAALTLSFILLNMLVGIVTALVVSLMVAFDPFFLGQSRLLNHEGFMVSMTLACIFAVLVFFYKQRQKRYVVLSGAAAGLALLTKSPAIVLVPLVGLIFLVRFIQEMKTSVRKPRLLAGYAGNFILWLAILCLVYFLLWPGMWVDPMRMLYEVFGNAFSNAFQGGRLAYTQELNPQRFSLDLNGLGTYFGAIFLKTTPITWLGVLLALAGFLVKKEPRMGSLNKQIVIYFGILALGFILMFGIAQGRYHNHYILTSFVSLDVIAGIGIAWGCGWLSARIPALNNRWAPIALLSGILVLHGIGALSQYPYYYTYVNPIAQKLAPSLQDPDLGYGEGLELAGEYLAQKPGAQNDKVMSWYAAGPFSYYYPGTTYNLLSSEQVFGEYAARMKESSYLVIYSVVQKPSNMPAKLMKVLEMFPPEHEIWLNGHEYVQIYKVKDFPDAFFTSIVN